MYNCGYAGSQVRGSAAPSGGSSVVFNIYGSVTWPRYLDDGGDPMGLKELMGWNSLSMVYKYTKATARSRALRAHDAHSPVAALMQKERKR